VVDVSAPPTPERPLKAGRATPAPRLSLGAGLLLGAGLGLSLALLFAPSQAALLAAGPAGLVGVVACELTARRRPYTPGSEPWRFVGYCVLLLTLAVLSLAAIVGPGFSALGWILAALLIALGVAASLPEPT
jgi:hypothetical protein